MSKAFDVPWLQLEPVSLGAICQEAVEEAALDYPQRAIRLERSDDARGIWDGDQLEDLVHDLIWTAVTHSQPTAPIRVSAMECAGQALMVVAYSGNPLPDHVREHLLDPDHRDLKPSATPVLCYCLEIIRRHGGRMELSSGHHEAMFRIWLPKDGERERPVELAMVRGDAS